MSTYDPGYRNNVPEMRCPTCGKSRPLDWFGPQKKRVVHATDGLPRQVIRYRKYVACWDCRETGRNRDLTPAPKVGGE